MRKTIKSKFLQILESNKDVHVENITSEVVLIDAMALIQTLKNPAATFGELSLQIFNIVLNVGRKFKSKRIDFVGDCYPDISIKGAEREKRSTEFGQVFAIINTNQRVPAEWKKYLSVGKNKESLLAFLSTEWRKIDPKYLKNDDLIIYVAESNQCISLKIENGIVFSERVELLSLGINTLVT